MDFCGPLIVSLTKLSHDLGPGWGEMFRTRPDRPWGPPKPPVQWVPYFPSGGKAAGAGRSQPTPPRAKVKERAKLHLYSTCRPS